MKSNLAEPDVLNIFFETNPFSQYTGASRMEIDL